MSRRRMLAWAITPALCLGVLVSPGWTAAADEPPRARAHAPGATLETSTTDAVVGERVTFTGTVPTTITRQVRLQREVGSAWATIAKTRTTRHAFTFKHRVASAPATTRYRVVAPRRVVRQRTLPPVRTPAVTVTTEFDSASLDGPQSVRAGDSYVITATLTPVRPGRLVALQTVKPGVGWMDLGTAAEDPSGQLSWSRVATMTLDSESYRVVVASEPGVPLLISEDRLVSHTSPVPAAVTNLTADRTDTSVTLSWNNPTTLDFAGTLIVRKQGTTPPTSITDGTLAAQRGEDDEQFVDPGLDPSTTYSYAVFPFNHAADRDYGAGTGVTVRTRPTARQWGPVESVDPDTGGDMDVSCPTVDFCGAIDEHGIGLVDDGLAGWSTPAFVAHEHLRQISCPADGFCVAIGPDHAVMFYNGLWHDPVVIDAGRHLTSVSCTSPTFCLVVDDSDHSIAYDGQSWGAPHQATGSPNQAFTLVSCASPTFCLAFTTYGYSLVFDGNAWGDLQGFVDNPHMDEPTAMECVSSTYCFGFYEDLGETKSATWDGTVWDHSTDQPIDTGNAVLTDMSCVDAEHCVAVDSAGRAHAYNGSAWSAGVSFDDGRRATTVSCATTSHCVALDDHGIEQVLDNGAWAGGTRIDPARGELGSVSCSSPTFCMAVDSHGSALTYDGSGWSKPTTIDPEHGLVAVSCATSTMCVATDWSQRYLVYDGNGWSDPASIGAPDGNLWPTALTCTSTTFCIVTGYESSFVYDGSAWSPVSVPDQTQIISVGCAGPTFCLGNANQGDPVMFDGTGWAPVARATTDAYGYGPVACGSPTTCLGLFGTVSAAFDGSDWSAVTDGPDRQFGDPMSCGSATSCVVVSAAGTATSYDGVDWSDPVEIDGGHLVSVSCPTADFCMAVDDSPEGGAVSTS